MVMFLFAYVDLFKLCGCFAWDSGYDDLGVSPPGYWSNISHDLDRLKCLENSSTALGQGVFFTDSIVLHRLQYGLEALQEQVP